MSAKTDAIWMPLYVTDYLGDTMHLTTEQHGAYMLLLMAAWQRGGALPDDDAQLSAIARLTPSVWRRHKGVLLAFFGVTENGLEQKRLVTEYQKTARIIETNRENGKKGGRPKKQNPNETENKPTGYDSVNRSSNPNHNRNETQSQSQSQPPSSKPDCADDDDGTSSGEQVGVACWQATDEIYLGLEIDHGIPVEFSRSVFDEWQAFHVDKAPQPPSTWHSRFLTRVREQWDRKQKPLRAVP